MSAKIIVSNRGQLKKKYTSLSKLQKAINRLKAADKTRGIDTTLVYVDDAAQMKKYNGTAVTSAKSAKQNKEAIDAIYKKEVPEYLMILGASDVVPFVPLKNTMPSDGDPYAYGDLPYACDAKYSSDPSKFLGPTRVLGRLPDLVGGDDDSYLINLLDLAANYKSRNSSDYDAYFGLTADVWHLSTKESLENIFGNATSMEKSPPGGPTWPKSKLHRRAHFVNCHGVSADPNFYGEKGGSYPVALKASDIASKGLSNGAVGTAECCYGAELYDPTLTSGQAGICNTFLAEEGYGFFGSSTIAYGPAAGNGAADLITQYFLKDTLSGASLGRATLQARQQFISVVGTLDPVDLKTIAQFYLLGDPSIHPVSKTHTGSADRDETLIKSVTSSVLDFVEHRVNRRYELMTKGASLLASAASARLSKAIKLGGKVKSALNAMAKNLKLKDVSFSSFNISSKATPKSIFSKKLPKRVFHLMQGKTGVVTESPVVPEIAVVAEEQNGKIVSIREYIKK